MHNWHMCLPLPATLTVIVMGTGPTDFPSPEHAPEHAHGLCRSPDLDAPDLAPGNRNLYRNLNLNLILNPYRTHIGLCEALIEEKQAMMRTSPQSRAELGYTMAQSTTHVCQKL